MCGGILGGNVVFSELKPYFCVATFQCVEMIPYLIATRYSQARVLHYPSLVILLPILRGRIYDTAISTKGIRLRQRHGMLRKRKVRV